MAAKGNWYDLFSRGARDWLRHNEKVRDAVLRQLPGALAATDITRSDNQTLKIPVHLLEHYRFKLARQNPQIGTGQGDAKPGDILREAQPTPGEKGEGSGEGEGEPDFILEMKIDDIIDWLWEELELPNMKPKESGAILEQEWVREGIDRRGARARLDRRRTMKESIKRRVSQPESAAIINDDLRFRQLARKPKAVTAAVVVMVLDASSSMDERSRIMAKAFFFWALQGLRRRYRHIETVFVAHTVTAWEFNEDEFFRVTATGGTVASVAFREVNEIITTRYDPSNYNGYLFYASDGENFAEDREPAFGQLHKLANMLNFLGYVEILPNLHTGRSTETAEIFSRIEQLAFPAATYTLQDENDIWDAIRALFKHEVGVAR